MRLKRLILLAVFIYIVYRIAFTTAENKQEVEVGQVKLQQINSQTGGIVSYFFSWIVWTFGLFGTAIAFLWSIIGYLWQILVIIANIIYTCLMYFHSKNRLQQKSIQKFFISFAIFIVFPLVINWFIAYRELTLNIFLPVQTSVFVDCLGNNNNFTGKSIRNLVTFLIICSFI